MSDSVYLGEEPVVDLKGTPYESFKRKDWALEFIERWGGIDGDDHKQWVLDQVARILNGTPVDLNRNLSSQRPWKGVT